MAFGGGLNSYGLRGRSLLVMAFGAALASDGPNECRPYLVMAVTSVGPNVQGAVALTSQAT